MRPPINKKRRKRDRSAVEANAPPKVLRKDHASVHPTQDTRRGKSLAAIGVGPEPSSHTSVRQSVSDPDPLSYAEPQPIPNQDIAQSSKGTGTKIPTEGVATTEGVTNDCRLDTPEACQDMIDHTVPPGYFSELRHLPNTEFLAYLEPRDPAKAEVDMKKATEAKNAELAKELESLRAKFSDLQLNNNQLS
ncbi:hypothetical protein Tco_0456557 [Tanacetum coccineum]